MSQFQPDIILAGASASGSVKYKRSLLTGRMSSVLEFSLSAPPGKDVGPAATGEGLVAALQNFLPRIGAEPILIENQRGGERTGGGTVPQIGAGSAGEDLFFASGGIVETDHGTSSAGAASSKSIRRDRIWYAVSTSFDRSDGKAIWYRAYPQASGELRRYLPYLSPRLFTRAVPISIDQLRIAFDLFSARSSGSSLFGTGPVVTGRVRIELTPQTISIRLEEQFTRKGAGIPLTDSDLPELIGGALARAGLIGDFSRFCISQAEAR